jgi:hypothetical protein
MEPGDPCLPPRGAQDGAVDDALIALRQEHTARVGVDDHAGRVAAAGDPDDQPKPIDAVQTVGRSVSPPGVDLAVDRVVARADGVFESNGAKKRPLAFYDGGLGGGGSGHD